MSMSDELKTASEVIAAEFLAVACEIEALPHPAPYQSELNAGERLHALMEPPPKPPCPTCGARPLIFFGDYILE